MGGRVDLLSSWVLSIALASGAVLSALTTPVLIWLAPRIGSVVVPRADRWHKKQTPLLGGIAIAFAALVLLVLFLPPTWTSATVVVGLTVAFALGLLDDFRQLTPSTKLVGQAVIGSFLFIGGVRVEIIQNDAIAYLVTILWIVGLMNAVNLIDNMD